MAAAALPSFVCCGGSVRVNSKPKVKRKVKLDLRNNVAGTFSDIFWLRFLENRSHFNHHNLPRPPQHYPGASELSCWELMMADVESLKLYLQYSHAFFTTSLPAWYDPQVVGRYFSLRPHVIIFRIFQVLLSFLAAASKLQLSRGVKFGNDNSNVPYSPSASKYNVGLLLRETFLDLGPTFVKVGQSLSTRPDIIGKEIAEALAELHDNVPPFPKEVAMKIIETELGSHATKIFRYISEEPIAAASFGQVYKACTVDGIDAAIKVQRPNLLPSVVRDIYILRLGLALLRKIANRKSDLALYADELGKGFVGELDYTVEADNASKFLDAHSIYSFMRIPRVFKQLSGKRVLTMEWLEGVNPKKLLTLSKGIHVEGSHFCESEMLEAKSQLLDLVNKGVEATLVQLLDTGLLHADPHPGNLCYTPDRCIGFLDFGLLCSMHKNHQLAMLASIVHIANGDWSALVYDLAAMDVIPPGTNIRKVTMDLKDRLDEEISGTGIPDIKFSKVLGKILSLALKYQFRMPPYYTLVLRSLASFEGLAVAADENFRTFQAAYPFVVRKLLLDNSLGTREVLYSVVFNKRKELQWRMISRFLKMGLARKGLNGSSIVGESKLNGYAVRTDDSSIVGESKLHGYAVRTEEGSTLQTANMFLGLLLSKDGIVIRRVLITADSRSLVLDIISEDASFCRQLVVTVLADALCKWMLQLHGLEHQKVCYGRTNNVQIHAPDLQLLEAAIRDRRLKIVFLKVWRDMRRHPLLWLRVGLSFLRMVFTALALGLRRYALFWSGRLLRTSSHSPVEFVAAAS